MAVKKTACNIYRRELESERYKKPCEAKSELESELELESGKEPCEAKRRRSELESERYRKAA